MRSIIQCILAITCSFLLIQANASSIQEMEQELSDTIITTKITTKFTENVLLNPLKISVSTQQGQVTLSGHVKNKEAFVAALRLAVATKGVKTVNTDHLDIKRVNTALTDAYITAKVEAAVLEAKVFDDESIPLVGINATTVNGMVTLTGEVKQNQSISAILKRANAVRGVKKIISNLHVKGAETSS
ncbi:MAG TPA: ornithine racemase [Legionella sp.]|nr:ornithine racemase [Legionella sp.]